SDPLLLSRHDPPRHLHSFPTRRSSDLNEQGDPKSPWHDLRVRQALNYAIDRQALSDQQTLGASPPTGTIVARALEFALPIEAYRSEEHTSELQSPCNLVCRLLLEKKKI